MKSSAAVYCFSSQAAAPANDAARWHLNNGTPMEVCVSGLNDDARGFPQPVHVVLDLSTLSAAGARVPALLEHVPGNVVGFWEGVSIDPLGGVSAALNLPEPTTEAEAASMPDVVRLRAFMRSGQPWQASVGVRPGPAGEYQRIEPGQSVNINGQTFTAGDVPFYVLRGGVIFEASVVTFGADSQTGPLAARRLAASRLSTPPAKAPKMHDRIKALLAAYPDKRHGRIMSLLAAQATDEDIAKDIAKTEGDEKTAELEEKIKAQAARIAELEGSNAAAAAAAKAASDAAAVTAAASASSTGVAFAGAGPSKTAPTSILAALALHASEHKGMAWEQRIDRVLAAYPSLRTSAAPTK
jgi:hypothetical protein